MTFTEFCKENNLDKNKLKPMVIKIMKKQYPGLSSASDNTLMDYADIIKLEDSFYIELSKYVKLWAFS